MMCNIITVKLKKHLLSNMDREEHSMKINNLKKPGLFAAGPTTASRMDKYAPDLLDLGLKGMIGKGKRSQSVIDGIVRNGAVYFAAVGGAGAILSKCIKKSTVIAYDDLGTEAIRELEVENLPVIVVIDSDGNNLYETAIKEYSRV